MLMRSVPKFWVEPLSPSQDLSYLESRRVSKTSDIVPWPESSTKALVFPQGDVKKLVFWSIPRNDFWHLEALAIVGTGWRRTKTCFFIIFEQFMRLSKTDTIILTSENDFSVPALYDFDWAFLLFIAANIVQWDASFWRGRGLRQVSCMLMSSWLFQDHRLRWQWAFDTLN